MSEAFPLLLTPWTGTILHTGSIGVVKGISWALTQTYHCETHYCANICSSLSTAVDCAEPGRQLATVFHLVGSEIDFGFKQ